MSEVDRLLAGVLIRMFDIENGVYHDLGPDDLLVDGRLSITPEERAAIVRAGGRSMD